MGKFLNKYYKDLKNHDDEKFKFVTYPYVKENYYVISNYGKFINFTNDSVHKYNMDKDGYYHVSIVRTKPNISAHLPIHRLVCWEFCKHKDGCTVVNHKDGKKQNNYYKNLEWTTVKANTRHAIKMGLTIRAGSKANNAKYPQEFIEEICRLLQEGNNPYDIIQIFYPGDKYVDHADVGNLIRKLRDKETHIETVKKYKFPKESFESRLRPKWPDKDIEELSIMIKNGMPNIEILHYYGYNSYNDDGARRITDKLAELRKRMI